MMRQSMTLAGIAAATLALTACDVRRDGAEEDPAGLAGPEATPVATPTATPSAGETQGASILREDMEVIDEVALPAQPFELTIPFPDGADLSERAERLLAGALRSDALGEDWPVIVGGHTDSGGNDQANLRASRARAEAVAAWLVERGVDDGRIQVVAFGEQNPAEPNANPDGTPNEAGRRANRRVELRIAPPPAEDAATQAPARSGAAKTGKADNGA